MQDKPEGQVRQEKEADKGTPRSKGLQQKTHLKEVPAKNLGSTLKTEDRYEFHVHAGGWHLRVPTNLHCFIKVIMEEHNSSNPNLSPRFSVFSKGCPPLEVWKMR